MDVQVAKQFGFNISRDVQDHMLRQHLSVNTEKKNRDF